MSAVKLSRAHVQKRKAGLLLVLAAILFVAFFPAGSNGQLATSALAACLFFVAIMATFFVPRGRAASSDLNWLPKMLALMSILCLVQLLSVPCDLLSAVAPLASEYYDHLSKINNGECVGSVSVDRSATLEAGLWWAALAVWAWMLVTVTHSSRTRLARLRKVLFTVAILQATYGLLMQLSGMELGAYFAPKEYYLGHATGTLINRNHFAALMYMASALAIPALLVGNAARSSSNALHRALDWLTSEKIVIRLSIVIFAIAAVNSHSRMGGIALGLGLTVACGIAVLFSLFPAWKKGLASTRYLVFLALSVAAVDLLVVSYWFDLEEVVTRIENTTAAGEGRDEIWADITESDWPRAAAVAGTGGGSFEAVYTRYESIIHSGRVDHAHNDWIQFWLEYGAVGALLFLLAVARLLSRLRSLPLPNMVAVLALLAMLAVHASVDFALRIPALGLYAVAAFVCLLSESPVSKRRRRTRRD